MRDRGTFNFSGNLEVKKDAPLEARSLVNSYADLVKPETWTDEQGGIWKYDCMLVSCKDRPGKVYQLSPGADYTKESSWILIGDTSELNNKVQEFIDSKGAPNGLASLNESGIIPSAQLPSYVDDVIEVDTFSNLPGTGESGKIYIVQDTNLTYRWSGTGYVEISKSLALGETSSTAYPGDKGKTTTDIVNSLSDNLVNDVLVSQSDKNSVSLTIKSITKNPVKKNKELLLADGEPILLTDNTPILLADNVDDGLYDQADDKLITINQASSFTAGVMSASDKTKIDKIITNGNGTKYLSDNGTYKEVQGGSADIESLKQYVNDSISSARSVGYMMQLTEIDASGLDENTWYPVTIAAGERMSIRVEVLVALDSGTKPSWSTHKRGFSVRKIWEFAPYAWGVNSRSILAVHLSDFNLANTDPVRGLSTLSNYDTCYVYVRGGGKYHFYASHGAKVILHTDTYAPNSSSQSISPTTEIPDLIREIDYSNWHSIKNVLNNGNEFNFADGEVGERVWLNYRSRSGNTVSAGKLYIGNGQATGGFAEVHASGFFKESDIRLKSNIVPLNHTLDQICNIPTVEFDMHDKHQIGTVAQDLENNFAEIVNTDSDGMKSVDYCMLGVVAVEGIKLLKQEIEDLKKQVEELKNGNAILGRNL